MRKYTFVSNLHISCLTEIRLNNQISLGPMGSGSDFPVLTLVSALEKTCERKAEVSFSVLIGACWLLDVLAWLL